MEVGVMPMIDMDQARGLRDRAETLAIKPMRGQHGADGRKAYGLTKRKKPDLFVMGT